MKDDHTSVEEILLRDSARINNNKEFDSSLLNETLRILQQRTEAQNSRRSSLLLKYAMPSAAVLTCIAIAFFLSKIFNPEQTTSTNNSTEVQNTPHKSEKPGLASYLAYQKALRESDESFLSLITTDSRQLLPETNPLFSISQ